MPQYVRLQQVDGADLKNIVSKLVTLGASGQFVYAEVNGVRLFSDRVSLDSAYREVTGMSYADYVDSNVQEGASMPSAKSRLTKLLNTSAKVISAELKNAWIDKLQQMIKTPYCVDIFENALQIIDLLNSGSLSEAAKVFFDCDRSLQNTISDLVNEFSEYGENFLARIKSESSIRCDARITRTTAYF